MKLSKLVAGLVAGLIFAAVLPATVGAAADTTPPPTPGGFATVGRSGSTLSFNWLRTMDNSGYVPRYELSYAGKTVSINHYYPGHSQNVSDLNLSSGNAYAFELRAVDAAGNRSLAPAKLVFETTPPGAAGNLQLVSMNGDYPDIVSYDNAPDNSGKIANYEVLLNGESLGTVGGAWGEFSLFEQVYLIACIEPASGPATVQLRAIDSSLNASLVLSEPLTVVFP